MGMVIVRVLGRACKRSVCTTVNRIAIKKMNGSKNSWWPNDDIAMNMVIILVWVDLESDQFFSRSQQNRHPSLFGPENF